MLEEIVVSARRKLENLQQTPVSVSALGENQLDRLQATDIGDLQNSVPGLTIHVGDASNVVAYIRGVGQIDSLAFADPGVGIYLDDVYLGRAQGAFLDVYDVDRIEVLRGPQGTLYGRNTIGGAIKYVSKQPDNVFAGRVEATVGDYGQRRVKAGLNVPIVEGKLFAKAAVAYDGRDGYATNLATGKSDGDKKSLSFRLGVRWLATDALTVDLSFDQSEDNSDTSRTPNRETSVFGIVPASDNPREVDADFNDLNRLKTRGWSGRVTYDLSDTTSFKSISAYREMNYDTHLDLDATALPLFGVFVDEGQDQFSQELQLSHTAASGWSLITGLYYFTEHDVTMSGIFGPAIAFISNSLNDQTNKSYAAYSQLDYPVNDRLSLTLGLRYTYETKDFARIQEFYGADTPMVPVLGTGARVTDFSVNANWSSLSPKAGLDYKLSDNNFLYASVSKGFKSGGFDGRSNSANQAVPYNPETMWAYEVGSKNTLLDGRMSVNLAAFYNDYKNLQLSSFVADQNGNFSALFTNAGAASIKGLELELKVRPTEALSLNAAVNFTDAHYSEYIGPGGVDISHERKLVNTPKWTLFLAGDYEIPFASGATLGLHGDIAYRSKTYPTVSSSEILAQPGYAVANAEIRYSSPNETWQIYAGMKNITDKAYRTHGFDLSDSLGYQLAYYGAPRTWSAGVVYRF
ncbi:TonB-dependent receptor [Kordiimonas marina]|uniref:TonB-dependent receptor n=1 Tax=Kordiimonas marina TaxID=2872312 RepID=UPI001FF19C4A|nr:TonB-dependent receptor [Kordiimonas marina]MCJ9428022.1 TonB-dependent receptor [Kordiimonas marina]